MMNVSVELCARAHWHGWVPPVGNVKAEQTVHCWQPTWANAHVVNTCQCAALRESYGRTTAQLDSYKRVARAALRAHQSLQTEMPMPLAVLVEVLPAVQRSRCHWQLAQTDAVQSPIARHGTASTFTAVRRQRGCQRQRCACLRRCSTY